jgi:hypothetical protein
LVDSKPYERTTEQQALAAGATARAKKRAVVAVARKLAVLLLTLWKNKSPIKPSLSSGKK